MKFKTIIIDPPWPQGKTGKRSARPNQGLELDYRTLSLEEIYALPVYQLVEPGTHVYLWTINKFLKYSFDILDTWGITFHVVLVWNKPTGVCPFSFQFRNEFVLFGYKDTLTMNKIGLPTNFPGTVTEHSRKPNELYCIAEQASFPPRLELFARRKREGWYSWGDEVESDIEWQVSAD